MRKRKQAKVKESKTFPSVEPIQNKDKGATSKGPSKVVDVPEVSLEEVNHASKRKKTKTTINLPPTPEQLLENASSSSIALGRQLGHTISLPGIDQAKIVTKDSVACGKEAMAFASQTLLWIAQQISKSEDESIQRVALEKAADDANNRATDEKLRADAAEKNLSRETKASKDHEADLNKRISELEKKLRDAEEAKLDAQAHWYKIGANKRLDKIKEAGFDHTKCLFEFEEEFDDDDDQEKFPQENADEN